MKTTEQVVDELYENVAKYHGITVKEVIRRTTKNGEKLIHQYYIGVYGNDYI